MPSPRRPPHLLHLLGLEQHPVAVVQAPASGSLNSTMSVVERIPPSLLMLGRYRSSSVDRPEIAHLPLLVTPLVDQLVHANQAPGCGLEDFNSS